MLKNWAPKILVVILVAINLPACATEDEKMFALATATQRVASAVHSSVKYKNAPETLNERELLLFATKHDPGLLKPFGDYKLHIKREHEDTVLLVCDRGDLKALLEDAGCTPKFENHLWQITPPPPCKYTLKPSTVCAR